MIIGKNIKVLREGLGMTQEQLAEKLSISAQAISKWENAQSIPDTMLLPAISKVFGVTIDELFREKREAYTSLASKLAAIYEDTNKKEDFQPADLAYKRLFAEGKYDAFDLYIYGMMNWRYAWNCFHTAEEYLNKAMELAGGEEERTYAMALGRLVELKADMKQSQQILEELKIKYEKKPESSLLRQMLIRAYIGAKQPDEAERMVDEAIESGSEEWFIYQTKGNMLYEKNNLQEALTCFEKAWAIDSDSYCDTLYSFLLIYKKLGDTEKAIATCKEWIKWYEDRGAIIEKKYVERELEQLEC